LDIAATVRRATTDDADAIAEVHVASWQDGYHGLLPDTLLQALSVADRSARWRERLTDLDPTRRRIYVAEADTVICGFAALGLSRDPDADQSVGELFGLYVAPQSWRMGLGSLLHRHALDAFRELRLQSATLWVLKSNTRARRFYETRGWNHDRRDKDLDESGVTLHATRYRRPSL
jgi:ribosomal protein S18 acetylase RimI-like enzyme